MYPKRSSDTAVTQRAAKLTQVLERDTPARHDMPVAGDPTSGVRTRCRPGIRSWRRVRSGMRWHLGCASGR